jgi:hypothetical protein
MMGRVYEVRRSDGSGIQNFIRVEGFTDNRQYGDCISFLSLFRKGKVGPFLDAVIPVAPLCWRIDPSDFTRWQW